MDSFLKKTRCPVVSTCKRKFVRRVDVMGLGLDVVPLRFEADIDVVRETTSTVVLRHESGRVLETLTAYNDYYGFLTSPEDPIAEAESSSEEFGARGPGPVFVEVVVETVDMPLYPVRANGTGSYLTLPKDWFVDDDATTSYFRGGPEAVSPTRLDEVRRHFVLWSSADVDVVERRERMRGALAQVTDGLPRELLQGVEERLLPCLGTK